MTTYQIYRIPLPLRLPKRGIFGRQAIQIGEGNILCQIFPPHILQWGLTKALSSIQKNPLFCLIWKLVASSWMLESYFLASKLPFWDKFLIFSYSIFSLSFLYTYMQLFESKEKQTTVKVEVWIDFIVNLALEWRKLFKSQNRCSSQLRLKKKAMLRCSWYFLH